VEVPVPELEFTIDPATGALTLHVQGIAGPACDDLAKLARELLGAPGEEHLTAEYHLRPTIAPRIQPRAGQ
jgi:hypothetical protein